MKHFRRILSYSDLQGEAVAGELLPGLLSISLISVALAVWRWASVTVTKLKRNYSEGSRESQERDFRQEPAPWSPKKKKKMPTSSARLVSPVRRSGVLPCSQIPGHLCGCCAPARARWDAALAKATQLSPISRKWSQRKLVNGVLFVTHTPTSITFAGE